MSASSKPFITPARERGVIAVMAAMLMGLLFAVAFVEFAVAALCIERRKTQNAVDAVALELGNEMILKKNTAWQPDSANVAYFLKNNGQDGSSGFASPSIDTPAPIYNRGFANDPTSASNPSLRDRWIPASVQVRASVAPMTYFQTALRGVLSTLPGGAADVTAQYNVDALARVQQVQLASFTISRARVMLLFDFSPSMRLSYAGHAGDWQYSGISTLKYAAKQMMTNLQQQYNFSVRVFGYKDVLLQPALQYSTSFAQQPAWSTAIAYNQEAYAKLTAQSSLETPQNSGTDLISPLEDALNEIIQNNDYLAGAPIMILVTDGEPDQLPGQPCTGDLTLCNLLAVQHTYGEMDKIWRYEGINGMGVETFTYLINRDNVNLQPQDERFMQNMAGNQNNQSNPNNYVLDQTALDNDYMSNFMLKLPIKDYCMSEDIGSLSGGKPQDMAYPRANEPISGYFTLGTDEYPANKDIYQATQVTSFAELFADLPVYPTVDPIDPLAPEGTIRALDTVLSAPNRALARFYYDPSTRRVWLNPWLCFNLTYYQDNPSSSPPRFRMRWGHPTLGSSPADPLSQH